MSLYFCLGSKGTMSKIIGSIILLSLLVMLLVMSTPVTRLGSGFLIGGARHIITYYGLVKEAQVINVKFPNENDITAKLVYKNPAKNLAILELHDDPKVKREPLSFSEFRSSKRDNYAFTLGYPWTNTMEDRHTLIEGFLGKTSVSFADLLPIDLALDPVHSGSPLINQKKEVVGMVLLARHATEHFPLEASSKYNYALSSSVLKEAVQSLKTFRSAEPVESQANGSMEEFIEAVRNNVVLIEAR
jgi:S1-C subfamily serine protease